MMTEPTHPSDIYPHRVLALDSRIANMVWYYLHHEAGGQCGFSELQAVCACHRNSLREAISRLEDADIVESHYGSGDARERTIELVENAH